MSDYKYTDVTRKIIGCAMKVHNELGNGFQEVIYQRALAHEMRAIDLEFVREMPMTIVYKGKDIGERRADFVVEESVMVELKAVTKVENVHFAQAINYLEAYELEVGLLINFGSKRLEFRRFANTFKQKSATSA